MLIGLALSICSPNAPTGPAVVDPATLTLTGLWKPSFTASPWPGTASAGTSVSNSLAEATNPPAAGTAVDSKTPALFDGVNDILLATGTADTYASPTAFTFMWMVKVPTAPSVTDSVGFWQDTGGNIGMGFNATSGVTAMAFDTATRTTAKPCTANAWHVMMMKLDAGFLYAGVDGVWGTPVACGSVNGLTSQMRLGRSFLADFLAGSVMFGLTADTALSDANVTGVYNWLKGQMPSAGLP